MKAINIQANHRLKELIIKDNKSLEKIDCPDVEYGCAVRKKAKLKKLSIYGCTNLQFLRAGGSNKTKFSFDIKKFTKLTSLYLNSSNLTTIDLSKNKNLVTLSLKDNKLKEINLSNNKQLDSLELNGNKLTVINLKNINGISWLDISNNQCRNLISLLLTN